MLLALGSGIAFADQGEPSESGAPTAQDLSETVTPTSSLQLTDPAAAEGTPHQDLDRLEAIELTQGVFEPVLQSPAGPFDELQVEKFLSDNIAVIGPGDQAEDSGVVIGGEAEEPKGANSPPDEESAEAESPEGEAVEESDQGGEGSPGAEEPGDAREGSSESSSPAQEPIEPATLLESTIPLRTEGSDGKQEAVDLSLEPGEDHIHPANPLVEVGIPVDLGKGIELPESNVQIELEGAPEERTPSTIENSVAFYPNVAQDTDLSVAPTPSGVETLTTIRSADAPRTERFQLQLPAGAKLQANEAGGAEVLKGEETILNIQFPTALDANGEGVPVSMQVQGDSLALTVEPTESTAWPILVDPVYEAYSWYGNSSNAGKSDWHSYTNFGPLAPMTTDPWGGVVNGLFLWAPEATYPGSSKAEWNYYVPRYAEEEATLHRPPTSFITRMVLNDAAFATSEGTPYPAFGAGIWDPVSQIFPGPPGHEASWGHLGNSSPFHGTLTFENGKPGERDKNAKVGLGLSLWSASPSSYYLEILREAYVDGAYLELGDEDTPTVAFKPQPMGWINNSVGSPIKTKITDYGLGVKSAVFEPEMPSAPQWRETLGCSGAAASPCPREQEFSFSGYSPSSLPTGHDVVKIFGEDIVGNKTPEKGEGSISRVELNVDHTAPEVSLSGSMTEQALYGTRQSSYTLNVKGVDGTPSQPQSGIASAEVKYDGQKVKFEGKQLTEWTPACKTENCPLSAQWTINAASVSPGLHTVEVTAIDAVGITSALKKFTFEVHPALAPTLSLAGSATEQATLGTSRPRYILKANASALAGTDGSAPYEIAYSSSFGSGPNGGGGQFNHPADVVTDAQGNRWVADKANNRVEEFTEKGDFIQAIVYLGSTGGKFNSPSGVAIDSYGDIDVTDTGNNRVVRLHENGTFDAVVGANVNKTKVESKGTLAEKNHCTASSGNVCQAGTAGSAEGLMSEPIGITTSGGGNFFVVEKANNRVEKFNTNGELLAKFGSSGTGEGQLKEPTAMITAPNGEGFLWVADTGNNRIEEWDSSYKFVRAVGKEGSGNGEFKGPDAIGADAIGDVYVADRGNSRVEEFNEKGAYLAKFGSTGAANGQFSFSDPAGIVVTGKGEILITDSGNNRVQTWIAPKLPTYSSSFGTTGSAVGQFSHPADVAIDALGNLWTVDKANNRIEEFTESGGSPKAFGSLGSTGGKLSSPSGIVVDPSGNVWVTDTGNTRVVEFGKAGEFLATFGTNVNKTKVEAAGTQAEKNLCTAASKNVCQAGTAGSVEGQMKEPIGIAASSGGNLYVVEKGNGRVEKFSPAGELLAKFGGPGTGTGQFKEPTAIAVAPDASLWVADSGNNRIQHWNSTFTASSMYGKEGSANGEFKHPDSIEVDPFGNVFVADQANSRVQEFSENGVFLTTFGTSGAGTGQFSLTDPAGIAANGKGEIWLTDTGNNRIEKWTQQILRSQISTKITVDGKQVSTGKATCTGESCPLTSEWILESSKYSVGKHTIEVEATDGLGRSIVKAVTIEVQKDATKPTLSSSGPLVNAPAGWVEQEAYALSASAKDGGYGATSLIFKIDGNTISTSEKPCPDGGCELTLSKSVNMATFPGGAHHAELVATDGAGNQAFQKWTINVNPDGQISTEEATDTLEALEETSEATVVSPPSTNPEIAEEEGMPGLEPVGGGAVVSIGTDVESQLSTDAGTGVTIMAPEGAVHFQPAGSEPNAGPAEIAGGVAAVTANSGEEVDSAIRPVYDGATDFALIRSTEGPETYSWTVELGSGWKLVSESEHWIELYYASGVAAMAITDTRAHDATGREVPTALSISKGNIVTLTVKHRTPPAGEPAYVYPIAAGAGYHTGFSTAEFTPDPPYEEGETVVETPAFWAYQLPNGSWVTAEGGETSVGAPEYKGKGEAKTSGVVWVPPSKVSRPFSATACWHAVADYPVPPEHPNKKAGECQITPRLAARGWVHGHFHYEIPKNEVWWDGGREGEIACNVDVESGEWKMYNKECHFSGINFQKGAGAHVVAKHFWRVKDEFPELNGVHVVCLPMFVNLYRNGNIGESQWWGGPNEISFVGWSDACPWPAE